ncbi:MAG: hypothetical protein WCK18_19060, partial [Prolixibacteraceae bacterium]
MSTEYFEIKEEDLPIVKEIYDYYVLNSTATFHKEKVTIQELKDSILLSHPKYKSFLICNRKITIHSFRKIGIHR